MSDDEQKRRQSALLYPHRVIRKEYATTIRLYCRKEEEPPAPAPPEGGGWETCGSAVICIDEQYAEILWFWVREVES